MEGALPLPVAGWKRSYVGCLDNGGNQDPPPFLKEIWAVPPLVYTRFRRNSKRTNLTTSSFKNFSDRLVKKTFFKLF